MKALEWLRNALALLGLVSTIVVVGFYLGYTKYRPACGMWVAAFTKECK